MDTTPFHLILFALDIAVLGGIFLWLRFRRNAKASRSAVYYFEKSLYVPTAVRRPSLAWDMTGILLFGGFGIACFVLFSRLIATGYVQRNIYQFNVEQSIVEGIAIHGTLFLLVTAALLYWNRRRLLAALFGCCGIFLAGLGFNILYWEPYNIRVEHYELRTSKLTKPLRIVFVSDIQTDRIGFHEINTLKKIQQQDADLIILGGDYIQTFRGTREKRLPEKFRQMLIDHPLTAPLGVYAVPGNIGGHAGVRDPELFRDTGIEYIRNTVIIENLGADKGWNPPIDLILLRLQDSQGLRGDGSAFLTDSGNFIVMAGHKPNYAVDGYTCPRHGRILSGFRNAERAPDLMLAGHTHGGQIVLPFYGPLFHWIDAEHYHEHVRQIPHNMWSGFFVYPNGGHLLITRGSGMERGWAPRIRLFCPVEISVIDIVPE